MTFNVLLMVLCTMLYSLHTCLLRYFKQAYCATVSSDLLVCYQYLISIAILCPFIFTTKSYKMIWAIKRNSFPHFLIRCSMIFTATLSWFYALSAVEAVNCIAISCLTPIFILLLAKISLKEELTKEIILLAVIAFAGALLIIAPNPQGFNSQSLFAVLTAFLWALNSIFTKKYLAPQHKAITIFFITAIILSLVALPYVLLKPHTINTAQFLFLTAITIIFDIANILLIWVFSRGKLVLVAPFDLLRVVFTTLFSSFMLHEVISYNAVAGIAVILIANSLSMLYGRKTAQAPSNSANKRYIT